MEKHRVGQEVRGGEMWARAFLVVSVGRKRQGRVSKFGIGLFE